MAFDHSGLPGLRISDWIAEPEGPPVISDKIEPPFGPAALQDARSGAAVRELKTNACGGINTRPEPRIGVNRPAF